MADLKWRAELRCARAAVNLELHARRHGRLPENLEALVSSHLKALPRDPFDDNPLRYRRIGEGCIIYSVGPDGSDDGGTSGEDAGEDEGHDIVFRLFR